MRFFGSNRSSSSLALLTLSCLSAVSNASPFPHATAAAQLFERQTCNYPCGYYGQLCCPGPGQCYTNANNQAACGAAQPGGSGGWNYWTSTIVAPGVVTKTQVYSSYGGNAAPTGAANACDSSQAQCGRFCCPMGNYWCAKEDTGVCSSYGGGSTGGILPTAPIRPTSAQTVYSTIVPTVTRSFETPVPTGAIVSPPTAESSGGLSGGAIAGIVIGVLVGILLLILLCLFCCAKAAFSSLLALFGIGGKKKKIRETTYIESHHHSSAAGSHAAAGAAGGRRWYGNRPSKPEKKSSGLGGAAGVTAALGGLALMLGLKRKHDRKNEEKSSYTGSSYSYSDYTSSSSASSGNRTRRSSRR